MKKLLLAIFGFLLIACNGNDDQVSIDEALIGVWIVEFDSGDTRTFIFNADGSGRSETSLNRTDTEWSTSGDRLTVTWGDDEEEIWTYNLVGNELTLTQIFPTEGFELILIAQ